MNPRWVQGVSLTRCGLARRATQVDFPCIFAPLWPANNLMSPFHIKRGLTAHPPIASQSPFASLNRILFGPPGRPVKAKGPIAVTVSNKLALQSIDLLGSPGSFGVIIFSGLRARSQKMEWNP